MKEAYSLSDLGEMIKAEAAKDGLAMAEVAVEALAKAAYNGTKAWLKESAALSVNKIDDFGAPFIDQMDAFVLPQIEKIDLDKDGK